MHLHVRDRCSFRPIFPTAWICAAAVALAAGCSDAGGGPAAPATYDDVDGGGAVDGGDATQDAGDAGGDGAADTADATAVDAAVDAAADAATDAATDADADADADDDAETFPDGFFDPPDAADDAGTQPDADDTDAPAPGPVGELYAHTGEELYRLDLEAQKLVLVGTFSFDKEANDINDIAIDRYGAMFAVSPSALYTCNRLTAACGYLAKLSVSYNGLTFVPEGTVDPIEEALIGMGADGSWNHIQFKAGKVTIKKLGTFASPWVPSGDGFSVFGIGTFATIKGKGDSDSFAAIDPKTGKITKILGETGAKGLFGVAWWSGKVYGFAKTGELYTIDILTGKAAAASAIAMPKAKVWYGAGVSTRANGG